MMLNKKPCASYSREDRTIGTEIPMITEGVAREKANSGWEYTII